MELRGRIVVLIEEIRRQLELINLDSCNSHAVVTPHLLVQEKGALIGVRAPPISAGARDKLET